MADQAPSLDQSEAELIEWANIDRDRDARVRRARAAGMSKYRINQLTGISRVTLDRILEEGSNRP